MRKKRRVTESKQISNKFSLCVRDNETGLWEIAYTFAHPSFVFNPGERSVQKLKLNSTSSSMSLGKVSSVCRLLLPHREVICVIAILFLLPAFSRL